MSQYATVRINGKDFKVEYLKEEETMPVADGFNFPRKSLIKISKKLSREQKLDTLLHEVIHVIDYDCQLELSERQVHVLGTQLFGFLKDNPDIPWEINRDVYTDFVHQWMQLGDRTTEQGATG
jgi:hypothetical protein